MAKKEANSFVLTIAGIAAATVIGCAWWAGVLS